MINLDESSFSTSVANGVTLVDYWAPWCRPCLMQAPILEEVAGVLGDKATIAKVNIDDSPELADKFDVQGIPTLIIFKDGEVAKRLMGLQTRKVLVDTIQEVLG